MVDPIATYTCRGGLWHVDTVLRLGPEGKNASAVGPRMVIHTVALEFAGRLCNVDAYTTLTHSAYSEV